MILIRQKNLLLPTLILNSRQVACVIRYLLLATRKKAAKAAKTVQVHYLCYLLDGTLLDDSYQTAQPIMLSANRQQFIKGWVEGIELLGEGGQAVLVIPPDLAYGEKGAGSMIPPNSTIIFWIEILHVAP
jgi:FKBP-type peptidyl-prolyl cis-trans isomerase